MTGSETIPVPFLTGAAFLRKCGPIPAPVIVLFCSAHQSSPHAHGRRGFSANMVGRSDAAGTPRRARAPCSTVVAPAPRRWAWPAQVEPVVIGSSPACRHGACAKSSVQQDVSLWISAQRTRLGDSAWRRYRRRCRLRCAERSTAPRIWDPTPGLPRDLTSSPPFRGSRIRRPGADRTSALCRGGLQMAFRPVSRVIGQRSELDHPSTSNFAHPTTRLKQTTPQPNQRQITTPTSATQLLSPNYWKLLQIN